MSRSITSAFATDKTKELQGIWVDYEGEETSVSVLIARAGGSNQAFQAASERLTRPHRRSGMDLDRLPLHIQNDIKARLYAETVVLDWKGVYLEDEEVPFNRENVIKVFKLVPDFMNFIIQEATNFQNFRIAARDSEAKN